MSATNPISLNLSGIQPATENNDMARRRFQRTGNLQKDGNFWRLRWYEDVTGEDGQVKRHRPSAILGLCVGPEKISLATAKDRAAAKLKEINLIDVTPDSLMRVADFIEKRFIPEYVVTLKLGGRVHYGTELKHVAAELGDMALRAVKHEHIQRLCLGLLAKTYTVGKGKKARQVSYSIQTALHVKNAASAVFKYAKAVGMYSGENPALSVKLPEMARKPKRSLSVDQAQKLLAVLPSPAKEMARLSILTSMNIAEICGLQWQDINLTPGWVISDGEPIPGMTLAVRRQWSTRKGGGAYHTVKANPRNRFLPVDEEIEKLLKSLKGGELADPVFVSSTGKPVDAHNLFNRKLRPIGIKLGMPWLGWHTFKHTHASLIRQDGASVTDQMAMMGHSNVRTTMAYGEQDMGRRREMVQRIGAKLAAVPEPETQIDELNRLFKL